MNVYKYLDQAKIPYSITVHRPVYSTQALAAELHEKGQNVAKTVIVKAHGHLVMCILAASDKVALDNLRDFLCTDDVELATLEEIQNTPPNCEEWAMSPFGQLYGDIRTIMDERLKNNDYIIFKGERHDTAIRISMHNYFALAKPEIVNIAYHP
jgi:Ala-tRNA(Pro) deacylase